MVRVIEGKIILKCFERKRKLLRVSGRFELSRVRVTEGKITANHDGNPGEIDFVRVSARFELTRLRVIGSQL